MQDYYLGEFTEEERAAGLADAAMKFAQESKSQRGSKWRPAATTDQDSSEPSVDGKTAAKVPA